MKKILIVDNDKVFLKSMNESLEKNEYFKVDESEFMSFNPQTTGFAYLIPKEEMDGDINEWWKEKMWLIYVSINRRPSSWGF